MKGFKTHRHDSNPKEKEFHDKFIAEYVTSKHNSGIGLERIALPTDGRGEPNEYLTDREKQIMISTIQWLGSPVGTGFLEKCGFEPIKK